MSEHFDPYHIWLGIGPEDQPPHHYRLLGLHLFESDPEAIEHAGDQRMVYLRTFQSGKHGAESQRLLNEISAAKLCLLNPEKRLAYDEALRERLGPDGADAPAANTAVDLDFLAGQEDSLATTLHAKGRGRTAWLGMAGGLLMFLGIVAALVVWMIKPTGIQKTLIEGDPSKSQSISSSEATKSKSGATSKSGLDSLDSITMETPPAATKASSETRTEEKTPASPAAPPSTPATAPSVPPPATTVNTAPPVVASADPPAMSVSPEKPAMAPAVAEATRKDGPPKQPENPKLVKHWERCCAALETLKSAPDDPQANLAVGRWYSLFDSVSEKGWPCLLKGGDESLKKLAQRELAPPNDGDGQLKLADSWFNLAQMRPAEEKEAMMGLASSWYEAARDTLPAGALKARAEKRLEEIARQGRPVPKTAGRGRSGDPSRVHFKPGEPFPRDAWIELLQYVEPNRDVAKGMWDRAPDGFRSRTGLNTTLAIPAVADGDYDLEVTFTRNQGDDTVFAVFLIGTRISSVALSEWHGRDSRFIDIRPTPLAANKKNVLRVEPGGISNNRRYTLLIRVRRMNETASVDVLLDGKPYLAWIGNPGDAALTGPLKTALPRQQFAIAAHQVTTFHSVRLKLLSGRGTIISGGPGLQAGT